MMGNEFLLERTKRAEGDLGPFVAAEVDALGSHHLSLRSSTLRS
jgi:hypothetical protein